MRTLSLCCLTTHSVQLEKLLWQISTSCMSISCVVLYVYKKGPLWSWLYALDLQLSVQSWPITTWSCEFESCSWRDVCDKVCQWLATVWRFFPGILVSSINKTDSHDIHEILLKVALNTINLNLYLKTCFKSYIFRHSKGKRKKVYRIIIQLKIYPYH